MHLATTAATGAIRSAKCKVPSANKVTFLPPTRLKIIIIIIFCFLSSLLAAPSTCPSPPPGSWDEGSRRVEGGLGGGTGFGGARFAIFLSQFLILRSAGEPEPRIRGALGAQRFLRWERKRSPRAKVEFARGGGYLDLGGGTPGRRGRGVADTQSFFLSSVPSFRGPSSPPPCLAPCLSPGLPSGPPRPRSTLQGRCARPRVGSAPRAADGAGGWGRLAGSLGGRGPRGLLPADFKSAEAKRRSQLDKQGFVTAAALIKAEARACHTEVQIARHVLNMQPPRGSALGWGRRRRPRPELEGARGGGAGRPQELRILATGASRAPGLPPRSLGPLRASSRSARSGGPARPPGSSVFARTVD